jgi:hypothetical protein
VQFSYAGNEKTENVAGSGPCHEKATEKYKSTIEKHD